MPAGIGRRPLLARMAARRYSRAAPSPLCDEGSFPGSGDSVGMSRRKRISVGWGSRLVRGWKDGVSIREDHIGDRQDRRRRRLSG